MKEQLPPLAKKISRREILRNAASLSLIGLGVDQSFRAGVEASVPLLRERAHSELLFTPEQSQRLKDADAVSLVFGGVTVRDAHDLALAVTSALEVLGPVGSIRYAHGSLDISAIANDINALDKSKISVYGHSLGGLVFGAAISDLNPHIRIEHLFLDNTPPSFAYTTHPFAAKITEYAPASSFLTGLLNTATYGNPFMGETAPPGLLDEQLALQKEGERHLATLSARVRRDRTSVAFFRPHNPTDDPMVKTQAAEHRLYDFFPHMQTYRLGGKQGHANPPENRAAYLDALTQAINRR